jgi:glycosyltransferase involved in cell wall biosynthesis
MKKEEPKRIVFASILKPVDDTRMFEKMGVTLAEKDDYKIFIIGYPSKQKIEHDSIRFLPLPKFKRLSFARFFMALKVLQLILQVKPEALVINTHELLIVSLLNRILFGTKIVYDIRENYYRNLRSTTAFPSIIRDVIASWVRLKEKLFAPGFHHFFLAEKGYEKEMSFFKDRYTIIENKALVPNHFSRAKKNPDRRQLLFSGTLAESTGVFEAIELARNLYKIDPKITLRIVGFCAQPEVLKRLQILAEDSPFISLIGGSELVPHSEILKAISESDFGIIYYPPSPHTENSIPTKLYEYLAFRLPILLQDHGPWIALTEPYHAAINIDFKNPNLTEIVTEMNSDFYSSSPQKVTWNSESVKFLNVMDSLLK